jgi:hypothetical protein
MMYALVEKGLRPGIAEIARLWSSLRRKDVLGVDLGTLSSGDFVGVHGIFSIRRRSAGSSSRSSPSVAP